MLGFLIGAFCGIAITVAVLLWKPNALGFLVLISYLVSERRIHSIAVMTQKPKAATTIPPNV